MRCESPYCGHEQEPNALVGDLDECDDCGGLYQMYANEV